MAGLTCDLIDPGDGEEEQGSCYISTDCSWAALPISHTYTPIMSIPQGNPKDSMKSTWREHPETWERAHHMLSRLNIYENDPKKPFPVHEKSDPVPVMTDWSSQLWIIAHSFWPMLVHRAIVYSTGWQLHPVAVFFLYAAAWKINAFRLLMAIAAIARQ